MISVTKVIDGDTCHCLTTDNLEVSIRLADIQAPNRGEYFYKESKEYLSRLILSKQIIVRFVKRDSYNRLICYIFLPNDSESINEKMVKNGYAINFEKYSNNPILVNHQLQAQQKKLGFWSIDNSIKKQYTFQKNLRIKKRVT